MNDKGFSIGQVVKYGWRTTLKYQSFFVGVLLLIFGAEIFVQIFSRAAKGRLLPSIIVMALALLVGLGAQIGSVGLSLAFLDRSRGTWGDFFGALVYVPVFFFGLIVYELIVFAGLILGVIPGLIWAVKFGLFPYFIVDQDLGPIESLRASSAVTKGARWDLAALTVVTWVINLLGVLALLVGLFATVPTTWLASARAYRILLAQSESPAEPVEAPPPSQEPRDSPPPL